MLLSADNFKLIMSQWATGVAIITAFDAEKVPHGFTANSITSVSLEPLLVSFCLKNTSHSLEAIEYSRKVVINILSSSQEELAKRFASQQHTDRFLGVGWDEGATSGCPLIEGCLAYLECDIVQEISAGDHLLFLNEVKNLTFNEQKLPLFYHAKQFKTTTDLQLMTKN